MASMHQRPAASSIAVADDVVLVDVCCCPFFQSQMHRAHRQNRFHRVSHLDHRAQPVSQPASIRSVVYFMNELCILVSHHSLSHSLNALCTQRPPQPIQRCSRRQIYSRGFLKANQRAQKVFMKAKRANERYIILYAVYACLPACLDACCLCMHNRKSHTSCHLLREMRIE